MVETCRLHSFILSRGVNPEVESLRRASRQCRNWVNVSVQERIKGTEKVSPYTPYSKGNLSRVIFKTTEIPRGLDNSQSHSAKVFYVDDPRSEPPVLHKLTLKKMAEDAESAIAIRFVDEND